MPSQAEQAFFDIAHSFLQTSGIDLERHLIGFEIVYQNDSGSKMIGFFALKVGGKYYYVPVFFINGTMKPLIMMVDKVENRFQNMDNDWLEFLENSPMPSLGRGVATPTNIGMDSNMRDFFLPPYSQKSAELLLPKCLTKMSSLSKVAFGKLIKGNKQLLEGVVATYGWDVIKTAMESIPKTDELKKIGKRDIIFIDGMGKQASKLTLKQKVDFQRNGFVIVDNRDQKKLVKTAETIVGMGASSAHEACEVDVLTDHGKRRVFLFPDFVQISGNDAKSGFCLFLDKEFKTYGIENSINIVYPQDTASFEVDVPGSIPVKNMSANKEYLIYGKSMDKAWMAIEPTYITTRAVDSDGGAFFRAGTCDGFNIVIKSGGGFSRLGKDLMIPESFKAVEVSNKQEDTIKILGVPSVYMGLNYTRDLIEYNASPYSSELYKNSEFLKKWDAPYTGEPLVYMMKYFNMAKSAAEEVARVGGQHWIKRAWGSEQTMREPMGPGYNPGSFPGGAETTERSMNTVGGLRARPMQFDSETLAAKGAQPDDINAEIQKAIQLSQMGAKDVFDKAVIGVLSKISDISSEIRSYLPEYVKCIDKLGRNIFLLWAKPEKIREKYDINEFTETETLLVDTFKNLGGIALDIRKKFESTTTRSLA